MNQVVLVVYQLAGLPCRVVFILVLNFSLYSSIRTCCKIILILFLNLIVGGKMTDGISIFFDFANVAC